jgi:quercetin dioxygenase-like cupin family protein
MSLPAFDVDSDSPAYPSGGFYLPAGQGVTKWVSGDVYTMKATAKDTGGALGLVEASVPPGGGPVAHAHLSGGEAFYLLSGELEFLNGERTFVAGQGDFVYIPPGTRHRFKNLGVHTAKLIFMFVPGGLEEVFVRGGDEPQPGEPAPAWGPEKFGPMQAVIEELGLHADIIPEL